MRFRSWLKHLGMLTGIYLLFAFVSLQVMVWAIRPTALSMMRTANREVTTWLGDDSDEAVARKFALTREMRRQGPTLLADLWWIDRQGNVLSTTSDFPMPENWNSRALPTVRLDTVFENLDQPNQYVVTLVRENPTRYLVGTDRYARGGSPQTKTLWNSIVQIVVVFFMWFLFGAAFLATVTVLYVFRVKARQAGRVMNAIETGDLKARFPLTKADEVGGLLIRFNRMADTIESLVARIRTSERKRVELLQELSHDLRTPLTSLSVLVQTLDEFHSKFSSAKRGRAIRDMGKELDYVVRLVQFLFTIADMDEASYRVDFRTENLCSLIQAELDHRRSTQFPGGKTVKWIFEAEDELCEVQADTALLNRVFRNALDNASKFAERAVRVTVKDGGDDWVLSIQDDGPGPNDEALTRFGKRPKNPTALEVLKPGQSTGLGSAILTAVAQLHGGNAVLKRGPRGGGLLELHLPKHRVEKTRRAA